MTNLHYWLSWSNQIISLIRSVANAKIKKKKGKRIKLLQKWDVDSWRGCIFFSDLSWPSLQQHFFPIFVLSQTLTNAARHIPLKWTNAIRMHLALIPRAHTTVLAILRLLEMVLSVKVSLVFEGDEIFYFVSHVECSSKLFRVYSHPTFTSRRHNITLPWAQERIDFWL